MLFLLYRLSGQPVDAFYIPEAKRALKGKYYATVKHQRIGHSPGADSLFHYPQESILCMYFVTYFMAGYDKRVHLLFHAEGANSYYTTYFHDWAILDGPGLSSGVMLGVEVKKNIVFASSSFRLTVYRLNCAFSTGTHCNLKFFYGFYKLHPKVNCETKNVAPGSKLTTGFVNYKKSKYIRNKVCQWNIKTTSPSIRINITRFIFDGNTERGCEHGGLIIHQRRGVKDDVGGPGMDEINRDNIWYLSCITHGRSIEVHVRAEVTITIVFFSGYSSWELAWTASESQCVTLTPNPCHYVKGSVKSKSFALLGYRTDLILTQNPKPKLDNIALPKGLEIEQFLLHVMNSKTNSNERCFVISQYRNWIIGRQYRFGTCDIFIKVPVIGAIDLEASYYTSPETWTDANLTIGKFCLRLPTKEFLSEHKYKVTYGVRGLDHIYTTKYYNINGYKFLYNIHDAHIRAIYCEWIDIYFTLTVTQAEVQQRNLSLITSGLLDVNQDLQILPYVNYAVMKQVFNLYLDVFVKTQFELLDKVQLNMFLAHLNQGNISMDTETLKKIQARLSRRRWIEMTFGFRGRCPQSCIMDILVFINIAGHVWDLSRSLRDFGRSEFSAYIPPAPVKLKIVRDESSDKSCHGIICDLTFKIHTGCSPPPDTRLYTLVADNRIITWQSASKMCRAKGMELPKLWSRPRIINLQRHPRSFKMLRSQRIPLGAIKVVSKIMCIIIIFCTRN